MIWLILLMLAGIIVLVLYALTILKNLESEMRALMRLRRLEKSMADNNQHSRMWYADQKGQPDVKQ